MEVSDTFDELYQATRIEAEETSDKSRDLKGRARGRWKPWRAAEGEGEKLAVQYTKASCLGESLESVATPIHLGLRSLLT